MRATDPAGREVWRIRVLVDGKRRRVTLGYCDEMTAAEAAVAVEKLVAAVQAGTWTTNEAVPADVGPGVPLLEGYAGTWLAEIAAESKSSTVKDLEWRLGVWILPRLGRSPIDAIDQQTLVAFRVGLLQERDDLRARLADPDQPPIRDERGNAVVPLANASINKIVSTLIRILDDAEERGFMSRLRKAELKPLRTKVKRKPIVDRDEAMHLLSAAEELDNEKSGSTAVNLEVVRLRDEESYGFEQIARELCISLSTAHHRDRRGRLPVLIERVILIRLLLGVGLRISEACELRTEHVDLARRYLRLADAKTSAGIRTVQLSDDTIADLRRYLAVRATIPGDTLLSTSKGTPYDRNSVDRKLLRPTLARANERLKASGLPLLTEGVSAQSLRKTNVYRDVRPGGRRCPVVPSATRRPPRGSSSAIGNASEKPIAATAP